MVARGSDGASQGMVGREVIVALDDMKFAAAHFVAFRGFREPLHGHNYTVGMSLGGELQEDGYLVDFGDLKKAARLACKELDHRTLLPMRSDVCQLCRSGPEATCEQVEVICEGGVRLSIPAEDCAFLPVVHTTAEEIAEHLWAQILMINNLASVLIDRGVHWLEVSVFERPGQGARHRAPVVLPPPQAQEAPARPSITPRPCLAAEAPAGDAAGEALEAAARADGEAAFRQLLSTLGNAEASRPELLRTPYRAAKAWRELTSGCHVRDPLSVVGNGIFEVEGSTDLVAVRDIPFHSLCEHHLLPFSGTAHVAYYPEGRVLGLSKFARLLQVFARRLQLQERLTLQFVEALAQLLGPRAIAVTMEAHHACMCSRGVGVPATTRTVAVRGPGKDDPLLRGPLLDAVARGTAPFGAGARL
mmetsp:Transcript_114985/g.256778  ORF Transcript_114985/g.256778 Transcript_114985/m.256778 type:complete len:418 (+) Transcript_114985:69-1322(+)